MAGTLPHRFDLRVYWEDTDAGGIVYYANYLKFMERARSELVRQAGIDQARLLREEGLMFAVRRCQVDYRAPARLDDLLTVETAVAVLGGASLELSQSVWRGRDVLVHGLVKVACVGRDGRAKRLPRAVRSRLAAWCGEALEV